VVGLQNRQELTAVAAIEVDQELGTPAGKGGVDLHGHHPKDWVCRV
jgi:hypothetical protein